MKCVLSVLLTIWTLVTAVVPASAANNCFHDFTDHFTDTVAAGSVNGSQCKDGTINGSVWIRPTWNEGSSQWETVPLKREATDVGTKISVVSGTPDYLYINGGSTTWGNERVIFPSITRSPGLVYLINTHRSSTAHQSTFGLYPTNTPGNETTDEVLYCNASGRIIKKLPTGDMDLGAYAASYYLGYAFVLRPFGSYVFAKGGPASLNYTYWTLLSWDDAGKSQTLYPGIISYNAVLKTDYVKRHSTAWLPTPIAYDAFDRANGLIGSSETRGPDYQIMSAKTWTAQNSSTWYVTANKVIGTSGSPAMATLVSSLTSDSTPDINAYFIQVNVYRTDVGSTGTGLMLRYQDNSNYVYAYHNRTQVGLRKVVAGTPTDIVTPVNSTFSSGAPLRVLVRSDGSAHVYYTVWYNNALVVSETDSGNVMSSVSYAKPGLYSTEPTASFDSFTVHQRGGLTNAFAEMDAMEP